MSNILLYIEQIFKSNLNDNEISHNLLTKAIDHLFAAQIIKGLRL
jgi:hypothetical protein